MATSTEQITDLIAGYTELKQFYENETGEIEAARLAALSDISDAIAARLSLTVYVDQQNGNDSNDGSLASPFASMQAGINDAPEGGEVEVVLIGDYHMYDVVFTGNRIVNIVGDTGQGQSVLTFAANASNKPTEMGGFDSSGNPLAVILLSHVVITLGTAGAGVSDKHVFGTFSHMLVHLNNSEIVVGAGTDQNVLQSYQAMSILAKSVVYTGTIAGRWRGDVASGTDPATVPDIGVTNIVSW